MPVEYQVDETRGVVITKAAGVTTEAELVSTRARRLEDPRVPAGMKQILDLREVTRFDIPTARVRDLAEEWSTSPASGSASMVAIVAASDEAFGVARMYEMSRRETPEQIRVFRAIEAAERWLGLDPSA